MEMGSETPSGGSNLLVPFGFCVLSQPFVFVSLVQEECSCAPEVISIACAFRTVCIYKWLIC